MKTVAGSVWLRRVLVAVLVLGAGGAGAVYYRRRPATTAPQSTPDAGVEDAGPDGGDDLEKK